MKLELTYEANTLDAAIYIIRKISLSLAVFNHSCSLNRSASIVIISINLITLFSHNMLAQRIIEMCPTDQLEFRFP